MDESRLVALRLMLNLTTPEYEQLGGDIRIVDNQIARHRRRATAIRTFLEGSAATRSGVLQDEIALLWEHEGEAKTRLAQLEGDARAATWSSERERRLVNGARVEQSEAEVELDLSRRRHDRARGKVKDLEEQLRALELSDRIRTRPHQLQLYCPDCGSSLLDRQPPPGCCRTCLGSLPPHRVEAERARISDEVAKAEQDASTQENEVRAADERAGLSWRRLESLKAEFDTRSRDSVTPYVDAIADARAELARIRQELVSLERIQDAHSRLRQQFDEISESQKEQEQRRRRLVLSGDKVRHSEDVIAELNAIFRRIVQVIDLPNATGKARLDQDSLLPLVDEQEFSKRGGGARSAVSIAYSLALLTYAREQADASLPTLLMVDSPQKNFGSNPDDKALAHRVYERFINYMSELSADGRFQRPFQLIIVDNDIHPDIRRRIEVIRFDRNNGFIRDLDASQSSQDEQLTIDG